MKQGGKGDKGGMETKEERGRRRRMEEKNKEAREDEWKERKKERGKILRSRGRVGLWCWASAALAPEKGGHHEVGGPPGPAPQLDICTSTLAIIRRVKGKAKGQ